MEKEIMMTRKVYLVVVSYDNLMDYEDHDVFERVLKIFGTREKALDYIKAWEPDISDNQRIIEDISEIKTEGGLDVDWETDVDRLIYLDSEKSWNRCLIALNIEERDVE